MNNIAPVILSGGAGTRLWPASVAMYPKQLLPLVDGKTTMLQDTAARLSGMPHVADTCMVICNEAHRFLVAEQLRAIDQPATIVLEPEGRSTAPAAALAACLALQSGDDALLLIMPADHVIRDVPAFQTAVARGVEAAEQGKLLTFGIVPTHAETGYGYVQAATQGDGPVPIISFVEKPDLGTSRTYVDGGEHFWNSGMFLFSAKAYLQELATLASNMYENVVRSVENAKKDGDFLRPDAAAFGASPSDSIDYAIMEKTTAGMMVPLDAGWSDVGSWASLQDVRSTDEAGNTIDGDVISHACHDSFIQAESMLVATVGLDNVAVIQTKSAVLVVDKNHAQKVEAVVDELNRQDREEARNYRQVFRPWGSFDSLENEEGWQVKRLIVNPGAVLSLQKHARRAEHWVVVKGKARVTLNDDEFDLGVNESTYIAIGDVHRIANPFDEPVHVIEVQCGDYLGEDDIVRIEDQYGREGTTT